MSRELSELQKQQASGRRAYDLGGYADGVHRIITTQGVKSSTDARVSGYQQLESRFGVQSLALGRAADSITDLAQTMRQALSADDGRGVHTDLGLAFSGVVAAMNESWNGQSLFSGERMGGAPVKVDNLDDLRSALNQGTLFEESERAQTVDLGVGAPIKLADLASDLSTDLFRTFADLNDLVQQSGGEMPAPLSHEQQDALLALAGRFEEHANTLRNAQGRAGQLESRFEDERLRMQARSDFLEKEIGEDVDADLARIQMKLSALLVQYEATAKTFGDISRLSLLEYL